MASAAQQQREDRRMSAPTNETPASHVQNSSVAAGPAPHETSFHPVVPTTNSDVGAVMSDDMEATTTERWGELIAARCRGIDRRDALQSASDIWEEIESVAEVWRSWGEYKAARAAVHDDGAALTPVQDAKDFDREVERWAEVNHKAIVESLKETSDREAKQDAAPHLAAAKMHETPAAHWLALLLTIANHKTTPSLKNLQAAFLAAVAALRWRPVADLSCSALGKHLQCPPQQFLRMVAEWAEFYGVPPPGARADRVKRKIKQAMIEKHANAKTAAEAMREAA